MNYIKIYLNLLCRAKCTEISTSYEKHHILPKSIFNSKIAKNLLDADKNITEVDCNNNIVKLSPREHFFAHLLLVKIFINIDSNCYQKMLFASNMLKSRTNSGREYEWLKIRYSKMMSNFLKGKPGRAKGKKWTEEAKNNKSKNHYMRGKTYEEAFGEEKAKELKELRAKNRRGKKHDNKTIEKLKYKKSEEHKKKISLAKVGKPITKEAKDKISNFFSNDLLNPRVDQTLYEFVNIKTKIKIYARRIDMKKIYKCNTIHKVIRDTEKSSKGWKFTGNIKKNKV